MKTFWLSLKKEIFQFDPTFRLFVILMTICSFLINVEYGITRPASNAIFVTHFSANFFPYAWLATVPLNLLVVYLYNRFLPNQGCLRTFFVTVMAICGMNALCGLLVNRYPILSFFQYIWKDIYILLVFKQLWSVIHVTINTAKAKFIYSLMFGVGGLGSVLGSFLPGFFAVKVGSEKLFFATTPIYLLLFLFYFLALKRTPLNNPNKVFRDTLFPKAEKGGFSTLMHSPYLKYILLLVVFMQISIAFVDYQFNTFLGTHIPTQDLRTQYCGRIGSILSTLTTTFQFLGGLVLVHFLGLKNSHRMVPAILLGNALLFMISPAFGVISYSFVVIKAMDFSIFSMIREMLYIPLSLDEKFRAKAIIDIFAYRSAKAFASFLLLFCQFFITPQPTFLVSVFSVLTFLAWSWVVVVMFRQHKTQADLVDNKT